MESYWKLAGVLICLIVNVSSAQALASSSESCPADVVKEATADSMPSPSEISSDFDSQFNGELMLSGGCPDSDDACNCALIADDCKRAKGTIEKCLCWVGCNISCRNVPASSGTFPNGKKWSWPGHC